MTSLTSDRTPPGLRLLVLCETFKISGGLLIFERVGRVLARWGHLLAWLPLAPGPRPDFAVHCPVLGREDAFGREWDAVMLPGVGFSSPMLDSLHEFLDARLGLRVQHVLGDRRREERFVRANRLFRPHLVLFNNHEWKPENHIAFPEGRCEHLVGAVDACLFRPGIPGRSGRPQEKFVIGGQARRNKNPDRLIAALRQLPERFQLQLFGPVEIPRRPLQDLIETGRLVFTGILPEEKLALWFRGLDAYVSTETTAGWCTAAAEAMASGIPVVCTPAGTLSFARHEDTALVLPSPAPEQLRRSILRLATEPEFALRLARRARRGIEGFGWEDYSARMVDRIRELRGALPCLT